MSSGIVQGLSTIFFRVSDLANFTWILFSGVVNLIDTFAQLKDHKYCINKNPDFELCPSPLFFWEKCYFICFDMEGPVVSENIT